MADKIQNPNLNRKRLALRHQEHLLTIQRLELRIMELEDEMVKVRDAIENTKGTISDIEKEMTAEGIEF